MAHGNCHGQTGVYMRRWKWHQYKIFEMQKKICFILSLFLYIILRYLVGSFAPMSATWQFRFELLFMYILFYLWLVNVICHRWNLDGDFFLSSLSRLFQASIMFASVAFNVILMWRTFFFSKNTKCLKCLSHLCKMRSILCCFFKWKINWKKKIWCEAMTFLFCFHQFDLKPYRTWSIQPLPKRLQAFS